MSKKVLFMGTPDYAKKILLNKEIKKEVKRENKFYTMGETKN